MSKKKSLSVIILTKNEAPLLANCLLSVNWADEIIILDSGSEDETLNIAQRYGVKIYTNTDWQGFGKQRNIAQKYAKGDYLLMVDADERISPLLKKSIEAVLMEPSSNSVYSCTRCNLFLGRFMRYSGWYPDRVIRLYPPQYQYNEDDVHESLICSKEKIIPLKGDILHLTCIDFTDFQKKQLNYAKIWAMQSYKEGKSCHYYTIFSHTIWAFCKKIVLSAGFLDGKQGLLLACVNAQYTFSKYTALWSLNQSDLLRNCSE